MYLSNEYEEPVNYEAKRKLIRTRDEAHALIQQVQESMHITMAKYFDIIRRAVETRESAEKLLNWMEMMEKARYHNEL